MKNIIFWLAAVWFGTSLSQAQESSGLRVERLGTADILSLPHPNPNSSHVHSSPVLMDDPEFFQGEKLQAQNGTGTFPSSTVVETSSTLSVSTSFAGLTLSDTPGYVPPDTQVAAGSNSGTLNLIEMANGTVRILNASGGTINTIDICSFFFCDFLTAVISDPIVRFDPASQRWFASVVTIEYVPQGALLVAEGQWRLAVSQSSDPNGAWTVYAATMSDGTFPDFPKMAISSDKVVQTGDAFTVSSNR